MSLTNDTVVHAIFKDRHETENAMVKAIKDTIYSFQGRVTVASTFGVLEIVKQDLIRELLT